jgi:glycosyltransferase involved in cell wall biosynthesis
MKILIGISYYLPNISGLTIYAKNLAEGLVSRGHKVRVITSNYKTGLKKPKNTVGIKIDRIWTPFLLGRGPVMPLYFLASFFKVRKVDVVNVHIPQFEGVFLCFWAKLLRKKIILTHHCDLSDWPGLINQITERVTYISLLMQGILADKIVVYTEDYANSSTYLSCFKSKLEFVLPPVQLTKVNKVYGFEGKFTDVGYKIGFAGRIAKEKGIDLLLNCIPILEKKLGDNFKIYIAGPGEEVIGGGHLAELRDLMEVYRKHLVLLGSLDQKQMYKFYKHLDLLVLPSTEKIESFGFVQVEAMLSGCPVIASDMPGVRIPIKLSKMGIVVKRGKVTDLSMAIITLLSKKQKIRSGKKAATIFSYDKSISAYEKLCKNLLHNTK